MNFQLQLFTEEKYFYNTLSTKICVCQDNFRSEWRPAALACGVAEIILSLSITTCFFGRSG